MTDHVCFKDSWHLSFGQVIFERGDDLFIDEITPNTCYTSEKRRPMLIKREAVILEGKRYEMQDAAAAGNALLKPSPSMEAVVAAATRRAGIRAVA